MQTGCWRRGQEGPNPPPFDKGYEMPGAIKVLKTVSLLNYANPPRVWDKDEHKVTLLPFRLINNFSNYLASQIFQCWQPPCKQALILPFSIWYKKVRSHHTYCPPKKLNQEDTLFSRVVTFRCYANAAFSTCVEHFLIYGNCCASILRNLTLFLDLIFPQGPFLIKRNEEEENIGCILHFRGEKNCLLWKKRVPIA